MKNNRNDIYALRTLEFVERLQALRKYDEICAHILKEMEWFGFTCDELYSSRGRADLEELPLDE